ncbi:serine/threonine protein kinase [Piscinibacter sakaiensis]|uniref:serine/threonine protein kinase n=1 Tax=Piscinibacter sakaiensis TaxID=1547922 RepID=UPI003AAC5F31
MSITNHSAAAAAEAQPATDKAATRAFGRFALRALIAKSERSMVWLANDPRTGQDVTLHLPRVQPADAAALEVWQREVGIAARLNHPNLAAPSEMGVQDHWPYTVVDRAYGVTLGEWLATHTAEPVADLVGCICRALEGLAFAHEAGAFHGDLQLHSLLINDQGTVRVAGLGVASEPAGQPGNAAAGRAATLGAADLRTRRSLAERDVLAIGLIAYRLFSGHNPLDKEDVSAVISRLPPLGREIVRLPWSTSRPVPDALRAIVNRATAAQERQRYLNARTLLRALNGWLEVDGSDSGGPLVLLIDRMRAVGHLPALPGVGQRIARLTSAEGQRTEDMANDLLEDFALSFELLRAVNSNVLQSAHLSGGPAVITVKRAVAMLGLDGIRRAGNALRIWPGPLNPAAAANLQKLFDQVRLAARVAQALRPAGYDPEVVYLVVMWQNLGRLLLRYHFPDEANQISQLMNSAPAAAGPADDGAADLPGLSESMASLAVLGVDSEAIGAAVAKYWGLGEEVQAMMRRNPLDRPVRNADNDAEVLRNVASAANEIVDAMHGATGPRLGAAMAAIIKRYARPLNIEIDDIKAAVQQSRQAMREGRGPLQAGRAIQPEAEPQPGVEVKAG